MIDPAPATVWCEGVVSLGCYSGASSGGLITMLLITYLGRDNKGDHVVPLTLWARVAQYCDRERMS